MFFRLTNLERSALHYCFLRQAAEVAFAVEAHIASGFQRSLPSLSVKMLKMEYL